MADEWESPKDTPVIFSLEERVNLEVISVGTDLFKIAPSPN
jgi:hypothetical protein